MTPMSHLAALPYRPLAPTPPITGMRFALRSNLPLLVGLGAAVDGEWPLQALTEQAGNRPLVRLPSPFGAPGWDVSVSSAGLAAVWSQPGSAGASLWTRVADRPPMRLTPDDPLAVFEGPRLVRGQATAATTALMLAGPDMRLVLLRRDAAPQLLPAVGRGRLLAGQLIHAAGRPLLVALCLPPGERSPERRDLRGEALPAGVLHVLPLDAALAAAGAAQTPWGDERIHEFDADSAGHEVLIVATGVRGWRAARGSPFGADLKWDASGVVQPHLLLTSPTVLVDGDVAHLALLEPGPAAPRLLQGRL